MVVPYWAGRTSSGVTTEAMVEGCSKRGWSGGRWLPCPSMVGTERSKVKESPGERLTPASKRKDLGGVVAVVSWAGEAGDLALDLSLCGAGCAVTEAQSASAGSRHRTPAARRRDVRQRTNPRDVASMRHAPERPGHASRL